MTATTGRLLSPRTTGFLSKYLIVFIFIGLVALLTILTDGTFLKPQNIVNVLRQISVIAILGIGLTVVIITAGIDLSVGAVLALSAVVATSLAQTPEATNLMYPGLDIHVFVAIGAGLLVGAICGAINGGLVAFTGIAPFIATLGMMTAARGVALIYSGGRPVSRLKEDYTYFGRAEPFSVPIFDINEQAIVMVGVGVPILIMIGVALFTHYFLTRRKTGKYVYALGSNEEAVQLAGINIKIVKVLIYAFSGLLAAIGGIILSGRISSGNPTLGTMIELDAIAAAVIGGASLSGGIGTVWGAIVGAMIIGSLVTGLQLLNVSPFVQMVVMGVIIASAAIIDQQKRRRR